MNHQTSRSNNSNKAFIQGAKVSRIVKEEKFLDKHEKSHGNHEAVKEYPHIVHNEKNNHERRGIINLKYIDSMINKIIRFVQSEEVLLLVLIFILMQEKNRDDILIFVLGYLLISEDIDLFSGLGGLFKI